MTGEAVVEGRLHPAVTLLYGAGVVRNAIPAAIALWVSGIPREGLLAALAALLLLGIPYAVVRWWRFRYRVVAGRLEVDSGVFVRSHRVIPLERVRAVSVDRPLLHRLLGLTRTRVEAAVGGSSSSELVLAAVTARQSEALRAAVVASDTEAVAGEASTPEMRQLHRAHPRMLLLAGATSIRYTLVPFGLLAGALSALPDVGLTGAAESLGRRLEDQVPQGTASITSGLVVLAALVLAAGALGSLFSDFGFRLSGDRTRLATDRGLLSRNATTAHRHRVLGVETSDTPVRRPFGVASATAAVGGLASSGEFPGGGRLKLVPLAPLSEVESVLDDVRPGREVPLRRHPTAARSRRLVRALVVPALALVVGLALAFPWGIAASVTAGVVMAWVGMDRWRSLGHGIGAGVVVTQSGSLDRRRSVFDRTAPVATSIRSSPWQRRRGLCTLNMHMGLGVGSRSVVDLGAGQVGPLVAAIAPWAVTGSEPATARHAMPYPAAPTDGSRPGPIPFSGRQGA